MGPFISSWPPRKARRAKCCAGLLCKLAAQVARMQGRLLNHLRVPCFFLQLSKWLVPWFLQPHFKLCSDAASASWQVSCHHCSWYTAVCPSSAASRHCSFDSSGKCHLCQHARSIVHSQLHKTSACKARVHRTGPAVGPMC